MGRWLPRVPNTNDPRYATTKVRDELVDPAGAGAPRFLDLRGVAGGSLFTYGLAGPPKGHAVYDPIHRIAFFDEGCCSWHRIVAAANVEPPPKSLATRSLAGLHTRLGIRFGATPAQVEAVYGPAKLEMVAGNALERTYAYRRSILNPPNSPCDAPMTFLFERGRLAAMSFGMEC